MIKQIIFAAALMVPLGIVCAVILTAASKFFGVKSDSKTENIRECLPGANCGACGYAGCDEYAAALSADGDIAPSLCIPGGHETSERISEILGLEHSYSKEIKAYIACGGNKNHTSRLFDYDGIKSCSAAKILYGGQKACYYGCLGFGDCAAVCPYDAICLTDGIAQVDTRKCVGCGLCSKKCPQNIIKMAPADIAVYVNCSNHDKGADTKKVCDVGCIACKKCEKSCPAGAIKVENNLAAIDYTKCTGCLECAKVCPTSVIVINQSKL